MILQEMMAKNFLELKTSVHSSKKPREFKWGRLKKMYTYINNSETEGIKGKILKAERDKTLFSMDPQIEL